MNGVHDMGGMQNMGPVQCEKDEPVFHAEWEGRTYALTRAVRAFGKWNLDRDRYDIEMLPAEDYLRMSYYERWFKKLARQVVQFGLVSNEELRSGKPSPGSVKTTPALTVSMASQFLDRGIPSSNDVNVPPMFKVGHRVRARNINPAGHTRLPRYARGKVGTIVRDHGVYSFPDTSAHFLGDKRQHVYSVCFTARELWGESASPRDSVYIDMWDDYLEQI
jgi:nitrile hydratase subunit beta